MAFPWKWFGIVVIILSIVGYPLLLSSRQCQSDAACATGQYCGADFVCHQVPQIVGNVIYQFPVTNAVIIAGAILGAAFILRQK